jgi:hypothetical protein
MWRFLQTVSVLVLCGVVSQGSSQSSPSETRGMGISVHFVQPRHAYGDKDRIRLRVEVSNKGSQTLLVCRDLSYSSDFCTWDFEVRDASGRGVPGWKVIGDRGEGAPDPFPNFLISNWIALAPDYTCSTMIDVPIRWLSSPPPGRYWVKATLSSAGPTTTSHKNDLRQYPNELAALPFPGWRGKTESNSVWIQITANK